jgi:hypothetical protein
MIYDDFFAEALVPLWHKHRYRGTPGRVGDQGGRGPRPGVRCAQK